MEKLFEQINRFQNLKNVTGSSKSSSYSVQIYFSPWSETVQVEFGGYDIGGWSRHEEMTTTRDKLLEDFTKKVDKAVEIVNLNQAAMNDDWDV